ncbi:MAG: class I SAM-dependent methyltransferase [Methylophilaceae bacterium]
MNQDLIWKKLQSEDINRGFEGAAIRAEFLIRRFKRHLKPGVSVMNVGIGKAILENKLLQLGCTVSSLDPDATSVERLHSSNIDAKQGYIEQIPFADKSFDIVFASEVLEHLSDEQLASGIQEIQRVLKPGGLFIGTTPFEEDLKVSIVVCPHCGDIFHRWGHLQSFSSSQLKSWIEQGTGGHKLEVRKIETIGFASLRGGGVFGLVKALIKIPLCKIGVRFANPNICFQAIKLGH